MNYWIFTVTNQKMDSKTIQARAIYSQRMKDSFWGLGEKTTNRSKIQAGDKIIFYIGIPERVFSGTATVASSNFKLSNQEVEKYPHELPFFATEFGVKLSDIEIWEAPKFVPDLVESLSFVENREYWGSYFQGGIRGITSPDYEKIILANPGTPISTTIVPDEMPASNAQFALESHLEEFIHSNWHKIAWGRSLRLYETPDGNGRQFPAGTWSIDFLAIDNKTNDLIIIELKRGQTSDTTVGQVLRYMGWVKENIALEGQNVRGIIVCHEIDDALRYAIQQVDSLEVFAYQVNFDLLPIGLK